MEPKLVRQRPTRHDTGTARSSSAGATVRTGAGIRAVRGSFGNGVAGPPRRGRCPRDRHRDLARAAGRSLSVCQARRAEKGAVAPPRLPAEVLVEPPVEVLVDVAGAGVAGFAPGLAGRLVDVVGELVEVGGGVGAGADGADRAGVGAAWSGRCPDSPDTEGPRQ